MKRYLLLFAAALLALVAACGGDDNGGSPTGSGSSSAPTSSLSPIQQSLSSVILQSADLPDGLEGSAPSFTTNEDLAGQDQDMLAQLATIGRQLGVDVQFIPTNRLDPNNPIRGGVQTTASVYTSASGASQTFGEKAANARANDWAANYPSIPDLAVAVVDQKIGDESLWLRITGTAECTFVVTPTPDPQGVVPSQFCPDTKRIIIDNLIFRSGRVYGYLQITGLYAPQSPDDVYVAQVKAWADIVAQRSLTTFPV